MVTMTRTANHKLVSSVLSQFRELVLSIQQEHTYLTSSVASAEIASRSSCDTAATTTELPTTVNTTSSGTTSIILTESTLPPAYNAIVPQRPARTRRRTNSSNTLTQTLSGSNSGSSNMSTPNNLARGALIIFEGLDRVGKSTLAKKLYEHLERIKRPVAYVRFPDRNTSIGRLINDQLVNNSSKKIDDRAMHLLFSANRWELDQSIRNSISKGTTVIVDRYSYTGIAYSCANKTLTMDWCCQVETGLPKPDLVVYLELPKEAQYSRPGFGDERYETKEYQESVRVQYEKLIKISRENWLCIDVENKSPDQLLGELIVPVKRCLESCANEPLGNLSFPC